MQVMLKAVKVDDMSQEFTYIRVRARHLSYKTSQFARSKSVSRLLTMQLFLVVM